MVELCMESFEDGGMPKDCYVSVRIGETQKLSKLTPSRTYRFPKSGERRFGKIEVFRRIGSCNVDVDPSNAGLRELSINCRDAGYGALGLRVSVAADGKSQVQPSGDELPEAKKESNKAKAAKEYLSKHSLEVRLSEAMQAVLREKPADPAEYLAKRLLETAPTQKMSAPPQQQEPAPVKEELKEPERAAPVAAEPLQLVQPVSAVLPFGNFYRANFQIPSPTALVACHDKFPAAPPGGKVHWKPSVATWLKHRPRRAIEVVEDATPPAAPTPAKFRLMPSVGTWLARKPLQAKKGLEEAKLVEKIALGLAFRHKASVGTWLNRRKT